MIRREMQCPGCGEELADDARFCGACGMSLVTDPNLGRTVAQRYTLKERIASGSVGVLYRAEQIGIGRKLAVKLLHFDPSQDQQLLRRFRREGTVLCRLKSPHTVTTYEFDRDTDGTLYIAMEFPQGPSLAQTLELEGRFDWPRVLRILGGLCDALTEAHNLGIIHRDLRPENILLEDRGTGGRDFVKVMDFGLAKLTNAHAAISHPGQTIGPIAYASPEQLMKKPIDARSDIYALGVLAHLLLTGKHPFHDTPGPGELVAAHLKRVPPPPSSLRSDIPADVDAIVQRCLDKDPDRRFPSATALEGMINVALLSQSHNNPSDTIREPMLGEEDTHLAILPKRSKPS
jgi:serine/threonine-protein kinase